MLPPQNMMNYKRALKIFAYILGHFKIVLDIHGPFVTQSSQVTPIHIHAHTTA